MSFSPVFSSHIDFLNFFCYNQVVYNIYAIALNTGRDTMNFFGRNPQNETVNISDAVDLQDSSANFSDTQDDTSDFQDEDTILSGDTEYDDWDDTAAEFEAGYDGDDESFYDDEDDDSEQNADIPKTRVGIILSPLRNKIRGMSSGKIFLCSAALAFVIICSAFGLVLNYFLSLINYQSADSDYFSTVSTAEELPEESPINSKLAALDEEEAEESLEATEEDLLQWNAEIEDITSDSDTYEIPISEDVFNILLIGSDTRTAGEVGRSDAMILVSINQKTETIYLTSFLRDCYVHIPGYGNTRLNHAFAYGGPDLLEETLEENFKIHVDRYVAVDFYSFMDVIDILGGVWIDVSEAEQEITNDYIWSMNKLMGEEWYTDYLWSSGLQKLNGKQTLCYARNRYTGNDYERTQRQRTIITEIISTAMSSSPSTLVNLAQAILPQITTDLSKSEILNYAANIVAYINYEVVSQQIPATGTYSSATISGMSVIRLNLEDNIEYLQSTIYAGVDIDSAD